MIALAARSFTLSLPAWLLASLALLAPGAADASVCSGFYSANFALQQGKLNPPMVAMSKPAKGVRFTEPNFKTCVVRATDHKAEPPQNFARNDYSRRQAFNANNTYFLIYSDGGAWNLYDANTLQYIRELTPLGGDAEAQWHPTDPNILYYVPAAGGTKLMKVDVRTNAASVVVDFKNKLPSWANNAAHIWTHSEGSPSADGRYWGFMVQDNSWNVLGYIVWDLQQNKLVGSRKDNSDLDNVSMSAQGRWFVANGDEIWAWSPDFTQKKKLASSGGIHTDLGIGANGHDVFTAVDFTSADGHDGDIYFVDLDSCPSVSASATSAPICPRTVLFSMYDDGGWATPHFSMKAFNKPGWLLLSLYNAASNSNTLPWFHGKVMAIELKTSPKIYPLAYTRRVPVTSGPDRDNANYWAEPHASVNRDFTRIIFNSNWGNSYGADVDAYIIELPANALGGGGGTVKVPSTGGNLPPSLGTGSSASTVEAASTPVSTAGATGSGSSAVFTLGCRICSRLARAGASWHAYATDVVPRATRPALSLVADAGRSLFVAVPAMATIHTLSELVVGTADTVSGNAGTGKATRTAATSGSLSASTETCVSTRSLLPIETDFRKPMAYHRCLMERGSR